MSTPTPRTQKIHDDCVGTHRPEVCYELMLQNAKELERDIAELNQRLIDRCADYTTHAAKELDKLRACEAELARVTEREKRSMATMQRKQNATRGREVILRDALKHISRINSPDVDDQGEVVKRLKRAVNVAKNALSAEPPNVVAVEDVKPLIGAGRAVLDANNDGVNLAEAYHQLDVAIRQCAAKYPTL